MEAVTFEKLKRVDRDSITIGDANWDSGGDSCTSGA